MESMSSPGTRCLASLPTTVATFTSFHTHIHTHPRMPKAHKTSAPIQLGRLEMSVEGLAIEEATAEEIADVELLEDDPINLFTPEINIKHSGQIQAGRQSQVQGIGSSDTVTGGDHVVIQHETSGAVAGDHGADLPSRLLCSQGIVAHPWKLPLLTQRSLFLQCQWPPWLNPAILM
ncbi:hypothetical protein SELMODRAFT_412149 [Selaginella moellendorffii]|uniref:Uncharacterized protein n=1 Tax=Selaginella moellendorffii TaxID=88036 RepID=D8RK79_SELML|nr:hypothetical protein SELMODRAFT_412149 [Selaginella moellendorffii]